jgi:RNA polymerase sigma factor (sigma-70 family)
MNEKGSVTVLLDLAREGDIDARNQVWERFYNRICAMARWRTAWRASATPESSKELAHDAFLRAVDADAQFESRQAFFGYLARIVRNLSMDLARRGDTAKAGGDLVRVLPGEGEDPEAVFGTGNRIIFPQPSAEKIALSNAIDTLREDLREVVHLKYWNQMTDKEIGTAIGKKASEVQALWKQAKLQLEKELAGKGKSVAT